MTNILSKAIPMTVLTPIQPGRTWLKRLIFWALGGPLRRFLGTLQALTFIHFARWVIIAKKDWPQLGGEQPHEELHYDYMLFCSNYNGAWDQYLDAFSHILGSGLNLLWKWSIGWPDARRITLLKDYVRETEQRVTDYYFSAYPSASTSDIKSALRVKAALEDLEKSRARLTPSEFQLEYQRTLSVLQHDLGSTGPSPIRAVDGWAPESA